MCNAVTFSLHGEHYRIHFADPNAVLPVLRKNGEVVTLPWGRRLEEPGALPVGGWTNIEEIRTGKWDEWFPKPVKLAVSSFMEKDIEDRTNWFDVTKGKYLQGMVAREGKEKRVYVVTITPERADVLYQRWPRIVSGNTSNVSPAK